MIGKAGIAATGSRKWSSRTLMQNPNADTKSPLTRTGTDRPPNTARRFAGVASSGESVWYCRSFAIAIVPENTADMPETCTALPITKKSSLCRRL